MKTILLSLLLGSSLASAAVVGEVSRMPVSDSGKPAFRVYGQVENFCSGTLISPRLVLTAAHCVYDQAKKEWMPVHKFTPGRNVPMDPFGSVEVGRIYVPTTYLNGQDQQDLAVLVLKEAIGLKTGWLNVTFDLEQGFVPHASALGGFTANGTITGYPGDKVLGTMWVAACRFYVPNQIPQVPQYRCDTYGGMSGSALVVAGPHGESLVAGVHTQGHNGYNSGVLLTRENKVFLQEIMTRYRF